MIPKRDNYAIQAEHARKLFLTYSQEAIISNAPIEYDEDWLYLKLLNQPLRIDRLTGRMFRRKDGVWISAGSHGEVLTVFDYLCDARPERTLTGQWMTTAALGKHVHTNLFDSGPSALETAIERDPDRFRRACEALGGVSAEGGDICFTMPLFPDLPILVRFWHADEEFPPVLDVLWDGGTLQYLRYETLYYALGILRGRLAELL